MIHENDLQEISFTSTTLLAESANVTILYTNSELIIPGTNGPNGPIKLVMQQDANLVLYDAYGSARWSIRKNLPNSQYHPTFIVQTDRNSVVYLEPFYNPFWSAAVNGPYVNNPYLKLMYVKETNFFSGSKYYVRGVVFGNDQELYDLFKVQL